MLLYRITFGLIAMFSIFYTMIYSLDGSQQYSNMISCCAIVSSAVWVVLTFLDNNSSVSSEVSALVVFALVAIVAGLMLSTDRYHFSNRYLAEVGLMITCIYMVGATLCLELISSKYFFSTKEFTKDN